MLYGDACATGYMQKGEIMANFEFIPCGGIEGLFEVKPKVFGDNRGYFMETYEKREFEAAGIRAEFVQDNQSMSVKGVLRGMHFQKEHPQGKLVRVISGEVFDVVVDLRKNSASYGKWFGILLSSEKKNMFYVPPGFAHGFLVMSERAEFMYKCTDFYYPEDEGGIMWNDPLVGIEWPALPGTELIFSEKDRHYAPLSESKITF